MAPVSNRTGAIPDYRLYTLQLEMMKNIKTLAVLSFVALLSFGVASCFNPNGPNGGHHGGGDTGIHHTGGGTGDTNPPPPPPPPPDSGG